MNPGGFDRLLRQGKLSFSGEKGLRMWFSMVNQFNVRNLTYPEDVSRAFAGIINVLTQTVIPKGFFWGLPIEYFDAALLWIPQEQLKRRLPKADGSEAPPSWSWMGWQGDIRDDAWWSMQAQGQDLHRWGTTLETLSSECEWLYVEEALNGGSSEPRPVQQGNHALRPRSYLITHAEIATFKLGDSTSFHDVPIRILVDTEGYFCGVLMGDPQIDWLEKGLDIECLAISSSRNKLMDSASLVGSSSVYLNENYYNVLWINRHDDSMTRQGIGRILKTVWDAHGQKGFEIVKLA